MDNDKFQELVINQFGEIHNQFGEMRNQFGKVQIQFGRAFEKLDRIEEFSIQHHVELELVARQVESLQEVKDISKSKFYLVKAPD